MIDLTALLHRVHILVAFLQTVGHRRRWRGIGNIGLIASIFRRWTLGTRTRPTSTRPVRPDRPRIGFIRLTVCPGQTGKGGPGTITAPDLGPDRAAPRSD